MKPAKPILMDARATLREAFERLNVTALGVLILIDKDGRFVRTVTDGDLRRLLLGGRGLDDRLAHLPPHASQTIAADGGGDAALRQMNEAKVDQLPAVAADGTPVGVWIRRDLQQPVYLSSPHMGEEEKRFVAEAFDTNWVAPLGPNVDAFEKELAARIGVLQAAATVSGTSAIHLALILLGVRPGDTVLCSSLTFAASAFPILYQGATPVFVDSDPTTWNMSAEALERALAALAKKNCRPKAAVIVNLYGQSADYDRLLPLLKKYEVPVVEDAAESLGATYRGKASGSLGDFGVFSFNGNKIITTSGGGMLVSSRGEAIQRARFLSTQARDGFPWYEHSTVGYNYRMSNVLAGIGRGQLRVLDDRVRSRRAVFQRYQSALRDAAGLTWMPEADFGQSTRWLTVGCLDPAQIGKSPAAVIARLASIGVEARHVWKPMHRQPVFQGAAYFSHEEGASFSDVVFERGLCLPSGSNLTRDQQDLVIERLSHLLAE